MDIDPKVRFGISSDGSLVMRGRDTRFNTDKSYTFTRPQIIEFPNAGSQPDTVNDQLILKTPTAAGSASIVGQFGVVKKNAVTFLNAGGVDYRASANQSHNFYTGSNIVSGASLIAQIYSGGLYINGKGTFTQEVIAGVGLTTPKSTLSTAASSAARGFLISANNLTLNNGYTFVYCDTTYVIGCSGTPTASCAAQTNSTDCNNLSSLGCSWSGGSCDAFSYDQSTCESVSGCTWGSTANCNVFEDEYSCVEGTGYQCSWSNGEDCGSYFYDESSCNAQSGCSWTSEGGDDCSTYYYDEESCNGQEGCSWDSEFSVCNGTFGASGYCEGTFGAGCSGTYFVEGCYGTYGSCTGTASCAGFNTEGGCNAVSGCSWSSNMNLFLPTIANATDTTDIGRFYTIVKARGSGSIIIQPQSGEQVNFTTSYTLSTVGQGVGLHAYSLRGSCADFQSNLGTCASTAGCYVYDACSAYSNQEDCENNSCSWSEEDGCSGGAQSCLGTYVISNNWFKVWSN
jgi:hypothetical protein